jgi:hypothetical protein
MKSLAPIALFVYSRPKETQELINSLKNNRLAEDSSLFIFSDAPKNDEHAQLVSETRDLIKNISGFKSVEIFEATQNKGLARSVIDGVTQVIDEYGKIIVLEDDDLLSSDFLEYMNEALETYEDDASIWSVTAYSPPIQIDPEYKHDVYLSHRGCSWGWGTWKEKWHKHDWDLLDYNEFIHNASAKKKFQMGGNDLLRMLELQYLKKMDSWAIRSCYSQFKYGMYTIYPVISKIKNIGFGENSTHCTSSGTKYQTTLSEEKVIFTNQLELNDKILREFKKYYDLDIVGRIGYFLKKHNLYEYFKWTKKYLRK